MSHSAYVLKNMKQVAKKQLEIKQAQQAKERQKVVALGMRRGYTVEKIQKDVLDALGMQVCTKTISRDKKAILAEWREEQNAYVGEYVTAELGHIEEIITALWLKFDETGDSRYLAEVRQNESERRKLLGLYAPDKKAVSVEGVDYEPMDREQIKAEEEKAKEME